MVVVSRPWLPAVIRCGRQAEPPSQQWRTGSMTPVRAVDCPGQWPTRTPDGSPCPAALQMDRIHLPLNGAPGPLR